MKNYEAKKISAFAGCATMLVMLLGIGQDAWGMIPTTSAGPTPVTRSITPSGSSASDNEDLDSRPVPMSFEQILAEEAARAKTERAARAEEERRQLRAQLVENFQNCLDSMRREVTWHAARNGWMEPIRDFNPVFSSAQFDQISRHLSDRHFLTNGNPPAADPENITTYFNQEFNDRNFSDIINALDFSKSWVVKVNNTATNRYLVRVKIFVPVINAGQIRQGRLRYSINRGNAPRVSIGYIGTRGYGRREKEGFAAVGFMFSKIREDLEDANGNETTKWIPTAMFPLFDESIIR